MDERLNKMKEVLEVRLKAEVKMMSGNIAGAENDCIECLRLDLKNVAGLVLMGNLLTNAKGDNATVERYIEVAFGFNGWREGTAIDASKFWARFCNFTQNRAHFDASTRVRAWRFPISTHAAAGAITRASSESGGCSPRWRRVCRPGSAGTRRSQRCRRSDSAPAWPAPA